MFAVTAAAMLLAGAGITWALKPTPVAPTESRRFDVALDGLDAHPEHAPIVSPDGKSIA